MKYFNDRNLLPCPCSVEVNFINFNRVGQDSTNSVLPRDRVGAVSGQLRQLWFLSDEIVLIKHVCGHYIACLKNIICTQTQNNNSNNCFQLVSNVVISSVLWIITVYRRDSSSECWNNCHRKNIAYVIALYEYIFFHYSIINIQSSATLLSTSS